MLGIHRGIFVIAAAVAANLAVVRCDAQPAPPDYSQWRNGPWTNAAFFPVSVWWQAANETGHSGPYVNLAAAAAASGINIFLGQGANWPERFGSDDGELEAVQQNGLFMIGGISVPYDQNTSNLSVASILALARSIGAQSTLIGYNAGDEPQCQPASGQTAMSAVPSVIAGIQSYDPTRIVTFNETDWMIQPQWQTNPSQCLSWDQAALDSTPIGSFDNYPATNPYIATQLGVTGTDYNKVSNDAMWLQGLSVQAMGHFAKPGQPLWAYVESGSDDFGASQANNSMGATVSGASLSPTGPQRFGSSWVGLTVSGLGLPSGTTIERVTDPTHAVLSAPASGHSSGSVSITGGVNNSDCVASVNLCVVNGNEYRATPAEVTAEAWMSIINGANGIEWFCHDSKSYSFCLGDSGAAGQAAATAQQNLAYVDQAITRRAAMLNGPTLGLCSLETFNYSNGNATSTASCSNGILTLTGLTPDLPGAAMVKSWEGKTFLFAQPNRRSANGARFSFALSGLQGQTATVVYDSNHHFDPTNSSYGATFALDHSGQFTDTLGAQGDDYQVKIYSIN